MVFFLSNVNSKSGQIPHLFFSRRFLCFLRSYCFLTYSPLPQTDTGVGEENGQNLEMDIEENQNPEIHIEQSQNPETNFEDRQNPEKDIENNQNPEMDFEKNKKPEMDSQERQSTEMDFEKSENPETESKERQNPEMDFEENENPETESEERKDPETETESDLKSMEFCDEASPRGVLEIPVSGTESDQSSSTSSSSSSGEKTTTGRSQGQRGQWKNVLELLKRKSARRFSTMPFLAASYEMSRRNLRRKLARIRSAEEGRVVDCEGFMAAKPSWRSFGYAELAAATANFSPGERILELFFCFCFFI